MLRILIAITIAVAIPALADSGYSDVYTGLLSPDSEHSTIEMSAETVDVVLKADKAYVEAVFYFTNNGAAADVDMIFPLTEWGGATNYGEVDDEGVLAYYHKEYGISPDKLKNELVFKSASDLPKRHDWHRDYIKSFSLTIDDKTEDAEIVEISELSDNLSYHDGKLFARWTVSFKANEKRKVVCTYETPYSQMKHGWGEEHFEYALYTGASWAGAIGEGVITITNKTGNALWFSTPDESGMTPATISVKNGNDVIEVTFADYEPVNTEYGGTVLRTYLAQGLEGAQRRISFEDLGLPPGEGMPGKTKSSMNFRTKPSSESPKVSSHPALDKDTPFEVISGKGEWWKVKLADGTIGWLRWRYVDDGVEKHYATFYAASGA